MDKCLSEEYQNLLEAVLSVPLAIMSSVLHDVCATLTFRAAATAARDLEAPPHRWRHHIQVSTSVSRVQARPAPSHVQRSLGHIHSLSHMHVAHAIVVTRLARTLRICSMLLMSITCRPSRTCSCLQVGLRMSIWKNAPLSKENNSFTATAGGPDAAAAPGAPVATNVPGLSAPGHEENVSAIPKGSTVVPAVEVGIVNQQLACVGDPSLEDQWLQGRIQEQLGVAVPALKLDATSVPLEAMLLVRSLPLSLQHPHSFCAKIDLL